MWNVTALKYPDFNRLMSAIPGGGSDASNTAMTSQIFRGNFFKLNDNKTFSCILGSGHFIYGSWKFNPADSIIRLEETGKSKHSILFWLKEWSSSQMILRQSQYGINTELTLVKERVTSIDEKNDYSALENNKWRIQPSSEESTEQIRQRVIGSLRFAVLYLSKQQDLGETNISLQPIVLPVIIATNGIKLMPETELEHGWKALFYSDDNALTGYNILKEAYYKKISVPDKEGLELDIDLLKQVLQNLQ
jgi:hypothetical protein